MTQSENTAASKRILVFYDGGCSLCSREIRHYQRLDRAGNVEWIDISDDRAAMAAWDIGYEAAMRRLHVVDEHGSIHVGAAAFVVMWRSLPRYRWLAALVSAVHAVPTLDFFYTRFADRRYDHRRKSITCRSACANPSID